MSLHPKWGITAACCLVAASLAVCAIPAEAQSGGTVAGTILGRHLDAEASRGQAKRFPRTEGDQAIVDGWPLYRTPRSQEAFNAAMSAMTATDGAAPKASVFKGCDGLSCMFTAPQIGADGWLPQGRVWVSADSYVLLVHSPRLREGRSYPRRRGASMKYFVLHEFNNSSRNTDVYDTISSHKGSVFVPLYMSRESRDAKGRRFVVIVQTAPYDVVSIHATNKGSAGPGVEVAKNTAEALDPLQGVAGILISVIVKNANPGLKVVNHRGNEGMPILDLYEQRLAGLSRKAGTAPLKLPFVPAAPDRMAEATAQLAELIHVPGASPPIAIAQRGFAPPKRAAAAAPEAETEEATPTPFATATMAPLLRGPIRLATRPTRPAAPPQLVGPIKVITRPTVPVAGAGG